MNVAYLLNQYPMPSQTFIRREILELESCGWSIDRFSIRSTAGEVIDPDDVAELGRTRSVLGAGAPLRLVSAVLRTLVRRPRRFAAAAATAVRLSRHADRGAAIHLVYLAEACVLAEWFAAAGTDHVHTHFGTNAPAVAMLVRSLGGPTFSFTVHGPEEFDRPIALHLRDKVQAAAFAVVISSFGRSQMYRWADREDWPKIHIVRCGLDASFLRRELSPVPPDRRLVCVGRLGEQKGQLVLIEAATRLLADGVRFELVLAGEGPLRPVIEQAIRDAGAEGSISITGWIDNARVRQELEAARALVLPSFAEGLPVAIMESLALGRPVITTTVAGIPELVDDTCGRVVPAGSVEDLTEAMRWVLDAPTDVLDEMGRRGQQRVAEHHDITREAALLAQLFEDVGDASPGAHRR